MSEEKLTGGFLNARNGGRTDIQVVVRPDEMSRVTPHGEPLEKNKHRRTRLAAFGLSQPLLDMGDPRYSAALYQANKYRKVRMKELCKLHGHVSSGAGALLSSASLALGASRFLYERVAETSDAIQQGVYLKQAAQLADSARQAELAAWELAAREGSLRRRQEAITSGQPWLEVQVPHTMAGRKKNAARHDALLDVAVGQQAVLSGASDSIE